MRLVEWSAADGTRIRARLFGDPGAACRIVCLPGLTRNSRDFDGIAAALTEDPNRPRTVLAVDFRGRGLSDRPGAATYRPDVEAADVIAGLDMLGWKTPAFIGTSRGGIVTMILAATVPDRVGPVVLNDIGPVIALPGLVAIRDRMAETIATPRKTWDEAVEGVRRAMGPSFPKLADSGWRRITARLYRDDGGAAVLDYDPALFDAFAAFDPTVGIPDFWPIFDALAPRPVLAIRGALSDLLSAETFAEMGARLPGMISHVVPDEGHAPLLDDAETIAITRDFVDSAGPIGGNTMQPGG
jgi:pimeloyl-ACP methyl ester carboxylesterase